MEKLKINNNAERIDKILANTINELIDTINKQDKTEKALATMIETYYGALNDIIDDNIKRDKKIDFIMENTSSNKESIVVKNGFGIKLPISLKKLYKKEV